MKIQPVQIIGTQRSGSNLLRLMLNQFEDVTAPHPPHILQKFVPVLSVYGNLEDPVNMYRLVDDVCTLVELNPVPWHLQLDREQIMHSCRKNTIFEIFRVIYNTKAEKENASLWVCKSMSNVNFLPDLESFEIKPLYIHLIRDGRDVACSFKNAIVGDKHIYNLASFWRNEQQSCMNLQKRVGNDRLIQVKYESLIQNPEEEMKRISEFLGISFTPEVFDFYKSNDSRETAMAGKMWQNLTRPIIKGNYNKYKDLLSRDEILLFEHIAGDILSAMGYDMSFPEERKHVKISKEQILRFNMENVRMKQLFLRIADKEDLDKRNAQKMLMESITARSIKVKKLKYTENAIFETKAII